MSSQPSKTRFARAVTLVELIVLMVILVIVAAVVVPIAVSGSDVQVISAARMIASDLEYAQNTAITYQKPVKVLFDKTNESYKLETYQSSTPYQSEPLPHPITKKSSYTFRFTSTAGFEQVDIHSVSFGGASGVEFNELGEPIKPRTALTDTEVPTNGTVTLQAGPHVYRVEVAPATGMVTVVSIGS